MSYAMKVNKAMKKFGYSEIIIRKKVVARYETVIPSNARLRGLADGIIKINKHFRIRIYKPIPKEIIKMMIKPRISEFNMIG